MIYTLSPYQTPPPQYQPMDRKKRKGKIAEDYSRDRAKKNIGPALETHQSYTIKYGVRKIVPEGH